MPRGKEPHIRTQKTILAGLHAFSPDGSPGSWRVSTSPDKRGAYSFNVSWQTSAAQTVASTLFMRRERPQLLVDPHTFAPTHLVTGLEYSNRAPQSANAYSLTLVQAVKQKQQSLKTDDEDASPDPETIASFQAYLYGVVGTLALLLVFYSMLFNTRLLVTQVDGTTSVQYERHLRFYNIFNMWDEWCGCSGFGVGLTLFGVVMLACGFLL